MKAPFPSKPASSRSTKAKRRPADASRPAAGISPEADIARNPQNGQAVQDRSLASGRPRDLSDGGARSARHTGEDAGD